MTDMGSRDQPTDQPQQEPTEGLLESTKPLEELVDHGLSAFPSGSQLPSRERPEYPGERDRWDDISPRENLSISSNKTYRSADSESYLKSPPHGRIRALATIVWPLATAAALALLLAAVLVIPQILYPSLSPSQLSDIVPQERIQLQNERLKLQNDARATLLRGLAGLLVLTGAWVVLRQLQLSRQLTQQQLIMTREGQITERFTRAMEQLGNPVLDVRLGGIYALERIAKDSIQDRFAIVEVLTAYVRGHAPWPPRPAVITDGGQYWLERFESTEPLEGPEHELSDIPPLRARAADVQAVMTVLGRLAGIENLGFLELSAVDLRKADLREATLVHVNFTGANLHGSTLAGARFPAGDFRAVNLREANLFGADLREADLSGANLQWALLRSARLKAARLQDARLDGADLEGADLTDARLVRADLRGVNLRGARLRSSGLQRAILLDADLRDADLSGADLSWARADAGTRWPEGFDWKASGVVLKDNRSP